jgi:lipopolysaccharide/colanic/teichoic acid biosynthesis glycosyltransferase
MIETIDAPPATDALAHPVRARNSWQRWSYLIAKRLIDIVASLLLLLLLLPIFPAVAIWIKRDSPGPILFRQTRLGRNGKPFTVYKFRSMLADANEAVHREYFLRLLRTAGTPQAATVFKVPNDQRVTRVGAILRQTSIDELPQLWNVLTGTMSLVGPRPPIPYEVEAYEPWMRQRLEVRPGITGLWQVSGRSRLNVDEMFRLDVEYVRRQSLGLDLKILLLTVPTVLAAGKAA